jgi:hypothetical protein
MQTALDEVMDIDERNVYVTRLYFYTRNFVAHFTKLTFMHIILHV